jgi:hypothetical protein
LVLTFLDPSTTLCQFVKTSPFHGAIYDGDVADQEVLQLLRNPNPRGVWECVGCVLSLTKCIRVT